MPGTQILVVDDEPDLELLLRQKFRRQIREGELEFLFARDGEEALQKLAANPSVGVVMTDINMPRMDGLTLLQKMKEQKYDVMAVMVSAYGDLGNIRTAMNRGAFDFVTKPIDFQDLEATLNKTREYLMRVREAAQEHRALNAIRQELEIAGNIQRGILPGALPAASTVDLRARMLPAKEVGGDFYDYFNVDESRIGFVVGDVSGKGVPAAFFMAVCRTLLRATALSIPDAARCVAAMNRMLCEEDVSSMFVTLLYGIVDTRTGELDLCSAGHDRPFLRRASGELGLLDVPRNVAASVEADVDYRSYKMTLAPGDTLFVYTDGATEAENPAKELFGSGRLRAALSESLGSEPSECLDALFGAIQSFAGSAPQSDDLTAMIVRFRGA